MPKQAHINIYGVICYEPSDEFADLCGITRLQDVSEVLQNNADAEEIVVHINSPGGDVQEGFGIYDLLVNTGKKVTTIIEARCYSIATVIALAGSVRKMAKNAEFMIHNPWGFAGGTADDLQKAADWIRDAENRLVDFYVEKTGVEEQQIRDLMKQETFMAAEQALEMKFITDVQEQPVKAYALVSKSNNVITIDMKKDDKNSIKKTISAICKKMNWVDPFEAKKKNLDYTIATGDNEGKTLHIDTEEAEPKAGDAATIDGINADGEYEVDGGLVITCVAGKVESVTPPADDAADSDEVKALKADLKKAQAEAAALKAEKADDEATIKAMKDTLEKVEKTKSNWQPPRDSQQKKKESAGEAKKNEVNVDELRNRRKPKASGE